MPLFGSILVSILFIILNRYRLHYTIFISIFVLLSFIVFYIILIFFAIIINFGFSLMLYIKQ